MTPQQLRNSILQMAIEGKLTEQRAEDGNAADLLKEIKAEKARLVAEKKIKKEKPLPEISEDEIPFDIPDNWVWCRLGSIIKLQSGQDLTPDKYNGISNGIPYITGASNIEDGHIVINRWTEYPKSVACKGDLLLTCKGTVGKIAYLDVEKAHIARQIMGINSYINIFLPYIEIVLSSYVNLLQRVAKSMIPGVGREDICKIICPLPPLAEQKRIVARLEEILPQVDEYEKAYNELQELNKKFPDNLKNSLLQMAIEGKLVEQRSEEGNAADLLKEIQAEKDRLIKEKKIKKEKPLPEISEDEMPFEIPDNWCWAYVGDTCINIQYGSSAKSSVIGDVPVIRMGNLQNGSIIYDNLVYTSDKNEIIKYSLDKDDLLFNRTNSKELVGKVAIYKGEYKVIYAGYLVRIKPLINSDYLNWTMQTKFYWKYCQNVRSDAISQSNINAEKLKRFLFPLPPLAEQKRIVAKLEQLLPLCDTLKHCN